MREVKEIMDVKKEVKELAAEFQELKKLEMELKMKVGKYDERATALLTEIGIDPKGNNNVVEILAAGFAKASPLIL